MTDVVVSDDLSSLNVDPVDIVATRHAMLVIGMSLEVDMSRQDVLAASKLPAMEVIDVVNTFDFQDSLSDLIQSHIFWGAFH